MRRLLAASVLLLLCAAIADADALHLKDGSRVDGKVTFRNEESCSIGKRRIPLSDIARIDLRDVGTIPVGARDGGVVLVDGSVRTGLFTGLTLGSRRIVEKSPAWQGHTTNRRANGPDDGWNLYFDSSRVFSNENVV